MISILLLLTPLQNVAAQKILLAAAENSIPTSYVENGKQTGILIDIIHEAFERAGYSVEIQLMPWARGLRWVKEGYVDGIFSAYITTERQEYLIYAQEELIIQRQAFFVSVDSTITFDGDINKLADKSIGIINGTSYGPKLDDALEKGVFKRVDQALNSRSNVRKLLAGRIDIIPSYRHVALNTAKTLGQAHQIKELQPALEEIPSYLAFTQKKDFSQVIKDFNKALASMKSDGTYDRIFNQYLQ